MKSTEIGDYVEQDEEIATIETDKVFCPIQSPLDSRNLFQDFQIDVSVNAPEAGTVKEYLANEEDTVTVGQDLVKLELGGQPEGGEKQKAGQEPKAPAPEKQPSSSDPEPTKDQGKEIEESTPEQQPPKKETQPKMDPEPKKEPESKAEDRKPSSPPKESSKASEPKQPELRTAYGSREERRVRHFTQSRCEPGC